MQTAGADCFRINLSHSNQDSFKRYVNIISKCGILPSIDTQGAQGRVVNVSGPENFKSQDIVLFNFKACGQEYSNSSGPKHVLTLNHQEIIDQVSVGDLIRVDFGGLIIKITDVYKDGTTFMGSVQSPGQCINNRAFDITNKTLKLLPLTEFDLWALNQSKAIHSPAIFHSFASSPKDIDSTREKSAESAKIIAKIESKKGLINLSEIAKASDGLLIDRGDLSREISISMIPYAVNKVIETCKELNKPVYIATNVLDSMMTKSLPSRAEISDIFNMFDSGATGMVLAAEAAIGDRPVESIQIIKHMEKIVKMKKLGLLGVLKNEDVKSVLTTELQHWL